MLGLLLLVLAVAAMKILCATGPAVAQGNDFPPDDAAGQSVTGISDREAPVLLMIRSRPVAVFRSSLFGLSPQERARAATERINAILAEKPGSVAVQERAEGTAILIGDEVALMITYDDLDKIAGETMDEAVGRAVQALNLAVKEWQEMRNPKFLLRSGLATVLATAALIFVVFVIRTVGRSTITTIDRLKEKVSGRYALGTFNPMEHGVAALRGTVKFAILILQAIGVYVWLAFVLSLFPYTRTWGEHLGTYAFQFIRSFAAGMIGSLPGILTVIVIFAFTRFLVRLVRTFFNAVRDGKVVVGWIDPVSARPTSDIVSALIWILALILAYPYLPGSSSEAFKGVSIFAGLVVSLGSASIFGQFMAGLTLMYSRAFKPGDYVLAGENEGFVLSIGYLSTTILTGRQEEISVPNTIFLNTATRNYSRAEAGKLPLFVRVGIGYSAPWRQVYGLLLDAAKQTAGMAAEPAPKVYQVELSDFYVVYELVVFLDGTRPRRESLSALHENVQDAFNRAGVQIMSPHYESDPAEKVWVPPDQWEPKDLGDQTPNQPRGEQSNPEE
jgi:small-conductance mechanosensitive channel